MKYNKDNTEQIKELEDKKQKINDEINEINVKIINFSASGLGRKRKKTKKKKTRKRKKQKRRN